MYKTATSDSVRSSGWGERFDAKKFRRQVYYGYYIYLPGNLSTISALYTGLTMVLHLHVVLKIDE